jgi:hypothetical protein
MKMANNVTNYITIEGNEAAQLEFARLSGAININKHENLEVADVLWNGDFDNHINWTIDNIGAKWCMVEEVYEDYWILTSAWHKVDGIQDKLYEHLLKFDEDVLVRMFYEDENPDFTGIRIRYRDEYIDEYEEDGLYEELEQVAEEAGEDIWEDAFRERLEEIHEMIEQVIGEEISYLKGEEIIND